MGPGETVRLDHVMISKRDPEMTADRWNNEEFKAFMKYVDQYATTYYVKFLADYYAAYAEEVRLSICSGNGVYASGSQEDPSLGCDCDDGWRGDDCELLCPACANGACVVVNVTTTTTDDAAGSTAIETTTLATTCDCELGWAGTLCDVQCPPCEYEHSACVTDAAGNPACACDAGRGGAYCQHECPPCDYGTFYFTLDPVRPRSRGARRSLRAFSPGVRFSPHRVPRCFQSRHTSTPLNSASDAYELHPDIASYGPSTLRLFDVRLDDVLWRLPRRRREVRVRRRARPRRRPVRAPVPARAKLLRRGAVLARSGRAAIRRHDGVGTVQRFSVLRVRRRVGRRGVRASVPRDRGPPGVAGAVRVPRERDVLAGRGGGAVPVRERVHGRQVSGARARGGPPVYPPARVLFFTFVFHPPAPRFRRYV